MHHDRLAGVISPARAGSRISSSCKLEGGVVAESGEIPLLDVPAVERIEVVDSYDLVTPRDQRLGQSGNR